jgi:catechol 2,3-dioxygenase-like lactoylglutathione lyase family enzyme
MKADLLASFVVFLLISTAIWGNEVPAPEPSLGPSIIGIDHIPVAVRDLDRASERYRALGFTLKPGRAHSDGIRNNHVKFQDGSGIELISPPAKPVDELTTEYVARIAAGDGPAYLSFHARNIEKLVAALRSAAIGFQQDGFITLADPRLKFLFFDQDNRSPTDRPEHFAHANAAAAMTGVWLALDAPARQSLGKVLLALGAVFGSRTVFVPSATKADVWNVQNGWIILLPKSRELHPGRPVVGVDFEVRDFAAAARYLRSRSMSLLADSKASAQKRLFIPPDRANGLWLEFHEN